MSVSAVLQVLFVRLQTGFPLGREALQPRSLKDYIRCKTPEFGNSLRVSESRLSEEWLCIREPESWLQPGSATLPGLPAKTKRVPQ